MVWNLPESRIPWNACRPALACWFGTPTGNWRTVFAAFGYAGTWQFRDAVANYSRELGMVSPESHGLIFQGPSAPADGSFPSLTVSLASGTGWFCHT